MIPRKDKMAGIIEEEAASLEEEDRVILGAIRRKSKKRGKK